MVKLVRGLRVAEKNGVAMAVNWPENELSGDEVIIPPAMEEETAKKRGKEYKCFDWWFCYQRLQEEEENEEDDGKGFAGGLRWRIYGPYEILCLQ